MNKIKFGVKTASFGIEQTYLGGGGRAAARQFGLSDPVVFHVELHRYVVVNTVMQSEIMQTLPSLMTLDEWASERNLLWQMIAQHFCKVSEG